MGARLEFHRRSQEETRSLMSIYHHSTIYHHSPSSSSPSSTWSLQEHSNIIRKCTVARGQWDPHLLDMGLPAAASFEPWKKRRVARVLNLEFARCVSVRLSSERTPVSKWLYYPSVTTLFLLVIRSERWGYNGNNDVLDWCRPWRGSHVKEPSWQVANPRTEFGLLFRRHSSFQSNSKWVGLFPFRFGPPFFSVSDVLTLLAELLGYPVKSGYITWKTENMKLLLISVEK